MGFRVYFGSGTRVLVLSFAVFEQKKVTMVGLGVFPQ